MESVAVTFTSLHRALGAKPGPLTDAMIDQAVAERLVEASDLDWKRSVPPHKGLATTDFPKDVAAMANSGGGMIVYGVSDDNGAAGARFDTVLSERHETALRQAAAASISPPVIGLGITRLGEESPRAVVVEISASVHTPHVVNDAHKVGVPVRNGPDTVWLKEPDIARMYRFRFETERESADALRGLYDDQASVGSGVFPQLVGVVRPRQLSGSHARRSREDAESVRHRGWAGAGTLVRDGAANASLRILLTRPLKRGLRRWASKAMYPLLPCNLDGVDVEDAAAWSDLENWRSTVWDSADVDEDWRHFHDIRGDEPDDYYVGMSLGIHDDGSISLAQEAGTWAQGKYYKLDAKIRSEEIEWFVAIVISLAREACPAGVSEYDVAIGIEWTGDFGLEIVPESDPAAPSTGEVTRKVARVESELIMDGNADSVMEQARELAIDLLNQGAIDRLSVIRPGQ